MGQKSNEEGDIVRLSRPWQPQSEMDRLRERILQHLRDGPRWKRADDPRWSWWDLRSTIGGAADTETFRQLVDELIEAGELVEFWEDTGNRWPPRHKLVLVEEWHEHSLRGELIEVRACEDVIQKLGIREAFHEG